MQAFPSLRLPLRHAIKATLLGACLAASTLPYSAGAQPPGGERQARTWNIAPGPLAGALDQFARQAGISVSYDAGSVAGKSSAGLSGALILNRPCCPSTARAPVGASASPKMPNG